MIKNDSIHIIMTETKENIPSLQITKDTKIPNNYAKHYKDDPLQICDASFAKDKNLVQVADMIHFLSNNAQWTGQNTFDPEEYKDLTIEQHDELTLANNNWYNYHLNIVAKKYWEHWAEIQEIITHRVKDDPWYPLGETHAEKCMDENIAIGIVLRQILRLDVLAGGDWCCVDHMGISHFINEKNYVFARGFAYHVGFIEPLGDKTKEDTKKV